MDEATKKEPGITEAARAELDAIRKEALHGDHRQALARLVNNIEQGVIYAAASGMMDRLGELADTTGTA